MYRVDSGQCIIFPDFTRRSQCLECAKITLIYIWKLMYNILLLDDALEDLKSQKKKIVSKTSRKNGYDPLKLVYAIYLHQTWSTFNLSKTSLGWKRFQVLDNLPSLQSL